MFDARLLQFDLKLAFLYHFAQPVVTHPLIFTKKTPAALLMSQTFFYGKLLKWH